MTTEGNRFRGYRNWWNRLRAKYAPEYGTMYCAKAQIGPGSDPAKVEHLYSAALFVRGERFYMFKSEADRDAFLVQCPGAEVCQDPFDPSSGPEIPSRTQEAI